MKRILCMGLLSLLISGCWLEEGAKSPVSDVNLDVNEQNSFTAPEPDAQEQETSTQVEGKVADGYLVGATVCLDVNDNAMCDDDEPSAISTEGGVYQLDVPTSLTSSDYPLIVDVPASAIDEDTQMPVGEAYTLSAPAGQTFVSPLTTLLHQQQRQTPSQTLEQIEADMKFKLGRTDSETSLAVDYIANADSELHSIAQVVAQVMAYRQTALNTLATDNGYEVAAVKDNVQALIATEIQARLYLIAGTLETNTVSSTVDVSRKYLVTSELADLQASLERETSRKTDGFDWTSYLNTLNGAYLLGDDFAIQFENAKGTLTAKLYQSNDSSAYTYSVDADNSAVLTLDDGVGSSASLTLENIGENGAVSLQWSQNAQAKQSVVVYPSQVLSNRINQRNLNDSTALNVSFYQYNQCNFGPSDSDNRVLIDEEPSAATWALNENGYSVSVIQSGKAQKTEQRFIFNEFSDINPSQFQGLILTFVNDEFTNLERIQGLNEGTSIDEGSCKPILINPPDA